MPVSSTREGFFMNLIIILDSWCNLEQISDQSGVYIQQQQHVHFYTTVTHSKCSHCIIGRLEETIVLNKFTTLTYLFKCPKTTTLNSPRAPEVTYAEVGLYTNVCLDNFHSVYCVIVFYRTKSMLCSHMPCVFIVNTNRRLSILQLINILDT